MADAEPMQLDETATTSVSLQHQYLLIIATPPPPGGGQPVEAIAIAILSTMASASNQQDPGWTQACGRQRWPYARAAVHEDNIAVLPTGEAKGHVRHEKVECCGHVELEHLHRHMHHLSQQLVCSQHAVHTEHVTV